MSKRQWINQRDVEEKSSAELTQQIVDCGMGIRVYVPADFVRRSFAYGVEISKENPRSTSYWGGVGNTFEAALLMGIDKVPSNVLDEDNPSGTPRWREALEADAKAYKAKEQERRDIKQAEKLYKAFHLLSLPFDAPTPKVTVGGYTWYISSGGSSRGNLIVQRGKHTAEIWLSDGVGSPLSAEVIRYFLLQQLNELDELIAGENNEPLR